MDYTEYTSKTYHSRRDTDVVYGFINFLSKIVNLHVHTVHHREIDKFKWECTISIRIKTGADL